MNKKGFTLIELLATLTILSIIMLIAVPSVVNIIDKQKNATYINDAKRFISLAKYQYRVDGSSGDKIYYLKDLDSAELNTSPNGDYSSENSYVLVYDGNYYVNLNDSSNNHYVCGEESELQKTKPVDYKDYIAENANKCKGASSEKP